MVIYIMVKGGSNIAISIGGRSRKGVLIPGPSTKRTKNKINMGGEQTVGGKGINPSRIMGVILNQFA
jgi:hypothetical protein